MSAINRSFFTKFHPTLPIVDNTLTPGHTFNACPLLYHTILLLATLATPNHPLTWSLRQTVNTAAPQHALSASKSVYLVQAFLLLATWPQINPQGSSINDQAWMYAGVATHMAQCIGIHRSFLSSEYTQAQTEPTEDTRREWVRTWVGCFIVGQLYIPSETRPNFVVCQQPSEFIPSSPKISPSRTPPHFFPPQLHPTTPLFPFSSINSKWRVWAAV